MKKIIIPTDFTDESENTIQFGIKIARAMKKEILLLHVIDIYDFGIHDSMNMHVPPPQITTEIQEERIRLAKGHFQKLITTLKTKEQDLPKISFKVEAGLILETLKDMVSKAKPLMILLTGKKPDDFLSKFVSDSNSLIVDEILAPVMVVPPTATFKPFKKIVYATDYRKEDIKTIKKLVGLADFFKARIIALHITRDEDFTGKVKQQGFLQLVKEKVGYDKIEFKQLTGDNIIGKINEFAVNSKSNVIVMLKENRGFLRKIFQSSSTEKLLLHTQLPVLVYHQATAI